MIKIIEGKVLFSNSFISKEANNEFIKDLIANLKKMKK